VIRPSKRFGKPYNPTVFFEKPVRHLFQWANLIGVVSGKAGENTLNSQGLQYA
jgi:hypothetical protein